MINEDGPESDSSKIDKDDSQLAAQSEHFAKLAHKWKPNLQEALESIYARDHSGNPMPNDDKAWLETFAIYKRELAKHPDTLAMNRIEEHLQAAQLDPLVCQSPELSRFVWLMRELLHEAYPGYKLEHILAPLFSLVGESSARLAAPGVQAAKQREKADNIDAVLLAWLLQNVEGVTRKKREKSGLVAQAFGEARPPVRMDRGTIRRHLRTLESLNVI